MHAVELKTGPIFAFLWLVHCFLFYLFFLFLKISFYLQKEEDFSKKKKRRKIIQTNDPFLVLKAGPTLLRNILGPVFNASLDQFFLH